MVCKVVCAEGGLGLKGVRGPHGVCVVVGGDYPDIFNPKAVLKRTLRSYSCLTVGDCFVVNYNNKDYEIEVSVCVRGHQSERDAAASCAERGGGRACGGEGYSRLGSGMQARMRACVCVCGGGGVMGTSAGRGVRICMLMTVHAQAGGVVRGCLERALLLPCISCLRCCCYYLAGARGEARHCGQHHRNRRQP